MDAPATTSADNGTSGGGEGWFTPRKQPTSAPGTPPASESPGTEPQATEGRRLAGLRPVGRGTATSGDAAQGSGRVDAGAVPDFGQTDADARTATPSAQVTAPSAPAPFDPATTLLPKLIPAPATAVPPLSSPIPPRRPGDTPPAGFPAADLASAAPSEAFQVPAQRTAPNGPPPAEAAHLTGPPQTPPAFLTPSSSLTPSEDHHRTLPKESRAGAEGETRPVVAEEPRPATAENPSPSPQPEAFRPFPQDVPRPETELPHAVPHEGARPEGELPGPFAQEATRPEGDLPRALSQEAPRAEGDLPRPLPQETPQPDAELLRPFAPNLNPPAQTPPPHDTPAESAPAQAPLAHDATPDTAQPQPEAPGSYVPDAFRPAADFSRPTAQSAPQDPAQPIPDAFRPFVPETLEVAEPTPVVEGSPDAVLVRRTMSAIGSVSDKVTSYFYALLFVRHPDLRPLFPPAMDAQRDRLLKALLTAAEHIDNTPVLVGYLQNLGRGHRKYGTRPEHYPAVGECLIEALAKYAASVWDKETEAAWVRTYTTISQVMIDAAAVDELRAPAWWQAEIVSHELRTQDIAVLTVRPDQPYPFLAGQYASLETPWWPRIWRHYSFASAPRSDGLLSFHVKAVPAGWVSNALVHRAQPGDVIRLGPPAGSMTIDHTRDSGLLCLGGGTGIAPIKALVEDVAEHGARRRMEVFYGARTDHDLYDIDTMLRLKQSHSWLEVRPVVDKDGLLQLPDAIRTFGPWTEYDAYISGPVGMIRSGVNALRGAGIPKERIRHDSVAELVAAG